MGAILRENSGEGLERYQTTNEGGFLSGLTDVRVAGFRKSERKHRLRERTWKPLKAFEAGEKVIVGTG